jgi:hypothetical protein
MDHLPLPLDPLLDPVEVPYRCTKPYDGGSMLGYPERIGWHVLYSPVGISYLVEGEKPSDSEIQSFTQNYLYFGLLHETFGEFCDIRKFITKNSSGESIITTVAMEDCLKKWTSQVEKQQDPESQDETDWWVDIQKLLHHTWKVALNTKKRHKKSVDERIWFSIAVLAETIQQVLFDLFRDVEKLPSVGGTWRTPQNPSIGKFICDEMLEKGWCIFDVHRIDLTTKGAATLYFLANLQPTRPGRDHSKCTKDVCDWMTTNDSYKTRHATSDCQCESHFSGINDIRKILEESEEIPLIQESPAQKLSISPTFQIIPSIPSISGDFIAISHVWAEGLGNPHANELPACSLKWISTLVDSLSKESEDLRVPFWIDTLCVPVSPHNLWLRAMNRLRKSYQDAAVVLVLDSYLYTQDSSKLSALEIWARVLCCSWSRRLWTFQEGRLSQTLLYQFADRAIPLETVFTSLQTSLSSSSMKTELTIAYRINNVLRSLAERMPDSEWKHNMLDGFRPRPDVRDMRESLQARSVSVIYDEALCLFCNMGFDMELITDLAEEERMPAFWKHVKEIPIGLIFSTARLKLTRPGLRWAPASFMGDIDTPHWYLEQNLEPRVDGFPGPNGLEIQVPGFLFDAGLLRHDDSFDTVFSDTWLNVQDQRDRTWYFVEMLEGYWNQDRKEDPKGGEQLAILIHKNMGDVEDDTLEDPFSFSPGVMAVIGVATEPPTAKRPPKIEVYRHALLHKFSRAFQKYNTMIQMGVERFVMESLGYTMEANHDEQGQYYESFKPPEEHGEENIENFELTPERRELCEQYCTAFAEENPFARDIALLCGHTDGRTPEQSFEHFGKMARFQLQMRRRNRVTGLGQTQPWCID